MRIGHLDPHLLRKTCTTSLARKGSELFLTLSWPVGHICPTYKESFQILWDNSHHHHRLYSPGWASASSWGFVTIFFLRGEVSLTPNPQPGGPGYPFLSGSSPLTCLTWEALPVAYATTSMALGIIWPHKPRHYAKVGIHWDNSIPLFLHDAIYLEVSLFRWTSRNALSRETAVYKWYCVQCCYAALHTVSFVHGCFAGKCILTGSAE